MLWFGLVCTVHFIDLYHWVSNVPTITMVLSCSNSRDWLVCSGLVLYVRFISLTYIIESVIRRPFSGLWFYHVLIHGAGWYALVWPCMYGLFH